MNVAEIDLSHFMAHDQTKVRLPSRGIVLVTGPNGAGKSCIVEGTSFGLWGRTLRGTPPWRADTAGEVSILTDAVLVKRKTTKGGKASLTWAGLCLEASEYPTVTKAQEALEGVIGSFDIWRRTHVFSSADAAHFTLATDGERKRLLESILGLERFDEALEACRVDLRKADERTRVTEGLLARHQERALGAAQRLEDARRALEALPLPQPSVAPSQATTVGSTGLGEKQARLQALQSAARADIARIQTAGSAHAEAAAQARAEARQLEQGLARLKASECPTCGQSIPDALRQEYRDGIEAAQKQAEVGEQTYSRARREVEAQIADLSLELSDLDEQMNTLAVERRTQAERARAAEKEKEAQERAAQVYEAAKLHVGKCSKAREDDDAEVSRLATLLAGSQKESEELHAVEGVLGLKGVRAHVLGRALGGLERVANSWLGRIAGAGLRLKLRPYSEKKTGGISDAISLDVSGAGGGYGYKASSGGERRRIDVALLLALAEVAQASHEQTGGTLFFDEVFDALDREGISAVSEALGELAQDRAVVVISHSLSLAESVPVALALRVEDGRIT